MLSRARLEVSHVTLSLKAARVNTLLLLEIRPARTGRRVEKGFVNIKHNSDFLVNTESKTLHFFTLHTQGKTARLLQFFTSLTL